VAEGLAAAQSSLRQQAAAKEYQAAAAEARAAAQELCAVQQRRLQECADAVSEAAATLAAMEQQQMYGDFLNAEALPEVLAAKHSAVQRYCRAEAAAAAILAEHKSVLSSLAALQEGGAQQEQPGGQEEGCLPLELQQLADSIQQAWQRVAATPRPAAVLLQQQQSLRTASPVGPLAEGIVQLGGAGAAGHTYEQQDMSSGRWVGWAGAPGQASGARVPCCCFPG
jgi:hypothetical protein